MHGTYHYDRLNCDGSIADQTVVIENNTFAWVQSDGTNRSTKDVNNPIIGIRGAPLENLPGEDYGCIVS